MPKLFRGDSAVEVGFVASEVSPYFQTTIKIGNRDIQELTTRAVEMELGVGFFGGAGSCTTALPVEVAMGPPSSLCSSFAVAPSFENIASQRIVKC